MIAAQLTLVDVTPGCKERGCVAAVVGSSITGIGHVCARHNTAEWGRALARSAEPHYRSLGASLLADAR